MPLYSTAAPSTFSFPLRASRLGGFAFPQEDTEALPPHRNVKRTNICRLPRPVSNDSTLKFKRSLPGSKLFHALRCTFHVPLPRISNGRGVISPTRPTRLLRPVLRTHLLRPTPYAIHNRRAKTISLKVSIMQTNLEMTEPVVADIARRTTLFYRRKFLSAVALSKEEAMTEGGEFLIKFPPIPFGVAAEVMRQAVFTSGLPQSAIAAIPTRALGSLKQKFCGEIFEELCGAINCFQHVKRSQPLLPPSAFLCVPQGSSRFEQGYASPGKATQASRKLSPQALPARLPRCAQLQRFNLSRESGSHHCAFCSVLAYYRP
jgi:hypothetical protein